MSGVLHHRGAASGDLTVLANLAVWYDAQDLATITKDGSNNISQWSDKSGNGKHATRNDSRKPIYSATGLSSKPCVDFSSNKIFSVSAALPNSVTVFLAWGGSHTTGTYKFPLSATTNNPNFAKGDIGNTLRYANNAGGIGRSSTLGAGLTAACTDCWVRSGASASFYQNKTAYSSASITDTGAWTLGYFGAYSGNGYEAGQVGELLIYSVPLSDADRNSVFDYLSAKWGF